MQKDSVHMDGGKPVGAVASQSNSSVPDEPYEDESIIACLGDDAAKLMQANPGDEMATTMLVAARRLEALLAALPKTADRESHDPASCKEDDGCPTEKAVLQRFWRAHQTPS